ncbi:MAG: carbonic anhydrase [Bacillales bacterium]|jgi:carbonic anhydrase|nr:carbonic anhydrase [Bacillales bacterium]
MNTLEQILNHNQSFVQNGEYKKLKTDTKFPAKEMIIVSCMDTRLTELLPKAMNVANGDAKIIKVAGAVISHPFGAVMRSIIVGIHSLGAEEVYIVGHDDCGMSNVQTEKLIGDMIGKGISNDMITILENSGIDINRWLRGFNCIEESIRNSVNVVKNHPLIPKNVKVNGLIINPETGALRVVVDGN